MHSKDVQAHEELRNTPKRRLNHDLKATLRSSPINVEQVMGVMFVTLFLLAIIMETMR